ncbi:hypothetical protein HGRIS_014351 [Hohenbuehelia grisea]|uniref:Inorganic diphosphatase n=1 Tax=Hohenbuehelia grisea TaxID=104357 RepID=A0ABR3JVB7_9AGAR
MPFTPVRRLIHRHCFRTKLPSIVLGKRSREDTEEYNYGEPDPVVATPPESPIRPSVSIRQTACETHADHEDSDTYPSGLACLAIQTEDTDEDVVVITALDTIPFCCHEDLLAMPRDRLVAVAHFFNSKLPCALWIDAGLGIPDAKIRKAIEVLVGIRQRTPAAPKSLRMRPSDFYAAQNNVSRQWSIVDMSPRSSPLTHRTRAYDLYSPSPRLARLDEVDETVFSGSSERPIKKRRVSVKHVFTGEDDALKAAASQDVFMTPTPAARARPRPTYGYPARRPLCDSTTGVQRADAPGIQGPIPETALKLTHRGPSTKTSSSTSRQNLFLSGPVVSSTPRRNLRRQLRTPTRASNIRALVDATIFDFHSNTRASEYELDTRLNREMIFGIDGMRMCESYDGDFDEMDTRGE